MRPANPLGGGQGRSVPDLAEDAGNRPQRKFTGWPPCTSAPNRRQTSPAQTGGFQHSARARRSSRRQRQSRHANRQRPRPSCPGRVRVSIPLGLSTTQGEGRPNKESLRLPQLFWLSTIIFDKHAWPRIAPTRWGSVNATGSGYVSSVAAANAIAHPDRPLVRWMSGADRCGS